MNNNNITPVALCLDLDLTKAFDTLNFDVLLHKLKYNVINHVSLLLIKIFK